MTSILTTTAHRIATEPASPTAVIASARGPVEAYCTRDIAVPALAEIDLDFAWTALTSILSPLGSGKSTLMHCNAGRDTVAWGRSAPTARTLAQ